LAKNIKSSVKISLIFWEFVNNMENWAWVMLGANAKVGRRRFRKICKELEFRSTDKETSSITLIFHELLPVTIPRQNLV